MLPAIPDHKHLEENGRGIKMFGQDLDPTYSEKMMWHLERHHAFRI